MSFSFGFTEDNFSDDELTENEFTTTTSQFINQELQVNPLDLRNNSMKPVEIESLSSLLQKLINVRLTFSGINIHSQQMVYRRELFDVKHQLMSEDNQDNDEEFDTLMGMNGIDLQKNVYEGGLKSWECSIDTVDKLSNLHNCQLFDKGGSFIELGCGTALPSTYIFQRFLMSKAERLSLILSDYNKSVLRLVTLPNLIITWALTSLTSEELSSLQRDTDETIPIIEDELQLSPALLARFQHELTQRNITINLISGPWGRDFLNLIHKKLQICEFHYIISSETIYSPETLPIISEILIELLENSKKSDPIALVAAKDIYFGVGGSVVEFENYLKKRINDSANIQFETEKINSGLQRSIITIK